MLISLSPTIPDAIQLFKDRCAGAKSTIQDQTILTHKHAPLSKLFHNRISTDAVSRLLRWYKNRWLSETDTDKQDSFLLEAGSLVHYGLQLSETLEALSENAKVLDSTFNALTSEQQEHEQPRIEKELQTIYEKQQVIYGLLDSTSVESMGLIQQVRALDHKLSLIEQEEEPQTTSIIKFVLSVPRTETVIGTIAAFIGAVGLILQIPPILCALSACLAVSMTLVRIARFAIADKHHAKNNDMLILREVMGQYMKILDAAIQAIFQTKRDTSELLQDTSNIKGTLASVSETQNRIEAKLDNAQPIITNNYIVVDPRYLLPPEQQHLLAQSSTNRPLRALTTIEEIEELDHSETDKWLALPRARKDSVESGYASGSSEGNSPPLHQNGFHRPTSKELAKSPAGSFEQDNGILTLFEGSSASKGKEKTGLSFELSASEDLLLDFDSSDSESEETVINQRSPEEKARIKTQKRAHHQERFEAAIQARVAKEVQAKIAAIQQFLA